MDGRRPATAPWSDRSGGEEDDAARSRGFTVGRHCRTTGLASTSSCDNLMASAQPQSTSAQHFRDEAAHAEAYGGGMCAADDGGWRDPARPRASAMQSTDGPEEAKATGEKPRLPRPRHHRPPEVDYTVPYKNYTWSNLLSDLKERVSWGDAQEFRATLHKQLRVGLDNDLVVMALDSGDFELHVEEELDPTDIAAKKKEKRLAKGKSLCCDLQDHFNQARNKEPFFPGKILDHLNKLGGDFDDPTHQHRDAEEFLRSTEFISETSFLFAPEILIVKLERKEHVTPKDVRTFTFPQELDLNPYTRSAEDLYDLYGVIVHDEYSMNFGHYISYVKTSDQSWFCCNDKTVTPFKGDIFKLQAYLLFYKRHKDTHSSASREEDKEEQSSAFWEEGEEQLDSTSEEGEEQFDSTSDSDAYSSQKDDEGQRYLHAAAMLNNIESLRILIEEGADINIRISQNGTPLHVALKYKALKCVEYLLEKKADCNLMDDEGQSPLHIAAMHNDTNSVRGLQSFSAKDTDQYCIKFEDHIRYFVWFGDMDAECIDKAFSSIGSNDRKRWILDYESGLHEGLYYDIIANIWTKTLGYAEFIKKNLRGSGITKFPYLKVAISSFADLVFPNEDYPFLTPLEEEGKLVQPKWYAPIFPLVLVNGCKGFLSAAAVPLRIHLIRTRRSVPSRSFAPTIWIPLADAAGASRIRPWPEELTGFVGVVVSDCQELDTDPTMQGIDPQSLEDKFLSPNEAKEISSYANHINTYLCEDPYLKNYLPMDPTGNQLFDLIRDGVLLCKLINLAVPGTIDEGYINKKTRLNLWERYEKHTLCLKYAEAIGCTVVNIRAHDLIEGRDIDKSDSCEKMTNGDSPKVVCSSDDMTEDGNLPEDSGDEDMGDADSDDIYLEGFRSPDETESEDDEEDSVDYLKKLAYYEFEAYNHNQSLEALDKKAGGAEEKRPEEKDTTREIVDVLDDRYELQVVKRLVRLHRLELPLVREAPTIIFGADMVRGEGFDSIASVVASVDWPKFRRCLPLEVMNRDCFAKIMRHQRTRAPELLHHHDMVDMPDCPFYPGTTEDADHLFATCPPLASL
nr:unnamed protein product [Digitaria exilis]